MINLKLDEQQAWFLTQILQNVLEQDDESFDGLFSSANEENDDEDYQGSSFDQEFKNNILEVSKNLLTARNINGVN